MTSLDIDSLFTNIYLDETINTCADNLYSGNENPPKIGPALANIFMCIFESKWLRDCPNDFKPVLCRRYIDDIIFFSWSWR